MISYLLINFIRVLVRRKNSYTQEKLPGNHNSPLQARLFATIRTGNCIHALFERTVAKNDHLFDVPREPHLLFGLLGYDLGLYLKLLKLLVNEKFCHWLYHLEYYKFGVYPKDITWQFNVCSLKRFDCVKWILWLM